MPASRLVRRIQADAHASRESSEFLKHPTERLKPANGRRHAEELEVDTGNRGFMQALSQGQHGCIHITKRSRDQLR